MTDWTSEEGISEEEKIYYYRKAGQIGYEVLHAVDDLIKPGVPLIKICEAAENMIIEKGADGFGFPTNVSINNIAAHYSSPYGDEKIIPDEGVVKFDIGIHVNGYIADTALTVVLSPELKDLKKAAEEGFQVGMEIIQEGTLPSMLGKQIEETITGYGYRPIKELTGHKLGRYELHGDKTLPNISIPYDPAESALETGEAYALETFATSGTGSIHEVSGTKYIYMLLPRRIPMRNPISRKIYSLAYKKYKSLPFAERWLTSYDSFNPARVRFALRELLNGGGIVAYPPLADEKGSYVAQHENTFIITENDGIIVTTQPPFQFEMPDSLKEKIETEIEES
ncbi:MAG: type II methionyl aminopeptidase [Candidatus Hermodarchaeota archaeon]